MATVQFSPSGRSVEAAAGASLLEAALAAGIELRHECGGQARCTTCHVRIESGRHILSAVSEAEAMKLQGASGVTAFSRLACQARIAAIGGQVSVKTGV